MKMEVLQQGPQAECSCLNSKFPEDIQVIFSHLLSSPSQILAYNYVRTFYNKNYINKEIQSYSTNDISASYFLIKALSV